MPSAETPEERRKRLLELTSSFKPSIIPQKSEQKWDADLVPEVEKKELSEADLQLDNFLQNFDVVQAYRVFIGKMEPGSADRKTEGIMISCPMPNHIDKDPSAWCNTQENLWFCGGCQVGGDIFDFGAIYFGYNLDTYKRDGTFPKLKRQIAERLGYIVTKSLDGRSYVVPPSEPDPVLPPGIQPMTLVPPSTPVEEVQEGTVSYLHVVEPEPEEIALLDNDDLFIDWQNIVPKETFLYEYLRATTIDDLPHEFYFWTGLQALAFAGGIDVLLQDFKTVKGNLYVCLYGRTGVGKTRSTYPVIDLLKEALPFDGSDNTIPPSGVKHLFTPASAESLFDQFRHEIKDPSTMATVDNASVSGLVKIEELAAFVARASRPGSSMKETLIEMFDIYGGEVTLSGRTTGSATVKNPFVQMLTTTQPKAIHAYLRRTDSESGFLNRWIFAAGKSRRAPMSYGGVSHDLTASIELLRRVSTWAKSGRRFVLAGDALDVWDNFFHAELAAFKTGSQEMESMLSRIDLTLKKLILLFTLNDMSDQPTAESVSRAIKLYPYLGLTYSAFSGDISFNDVTECQNKIMEVIEKHHVRKGDYPTGREVRQLISKKFDSELILRALKNLVMLDIVFEEMPKSGSRGRPTKRYGLMGR